MGMFYGHSQYIPGLQSEGRCAAGYGGAASSKVTTIVVTPVERSKYIQVSLSRA